MSAGDVDRDRNTRVACLGTGHRSHSALSKPLGLQGVVDRAVVVGRGRSGWGGANKRGARLFHGNGALGRLRRRFVRVRRSSRGGVRHRARGGGVWVEDEFLNSHNLFAVAELLQLAE